MLQFKALLKLHNHSHKLIVVITLTSFHKMVFPLHLKSEKSNWKKNAITLFQRNPAAGSCMLALGTWTRPSVKEGNGWRSEVCGGGGVRPRNSPVNCAWILVAVCQAAMCSFVLKASILFTAPWVHLQFSLIIKCEWVTIWYRICSYWDSIPAHS